MDDDSKSTFGKPNAILPNAYQHISMAKVVLDHFSTVTTPIHRKQIHIRPEFILAIQLSLAYFETMEAWDVLFLDLTPPDRRERGICYPLWS